jgi:hypothetical protein
MAQAYGTLFFLKLGLKNLAMVSNPELASRVLHTQGVEFEPAHVTLSSIYSLAMDRTWCSPSMAIIERRCAAS